MAEFQACARRLGEDAAVSVRQLRRWENPSPPLPHPGQQRVLETMLGVPLEDMGFDVPPNRRHGSGRGSCSVPRRTFIADLGAAAAASVLPDARRVGMSDVHSLRERVDGLYRVDHVVGGATALERGYAVLADIETCLSEGRTIEPVAVELRTMVAELRCHLGWFAHDAGHTDQARASILEAMATARMTGSAILEMRALATMCLLAVDQHRAWEARSAAAAARDIATGHAGPAVRLVLALRQSSTALASQDPATSRRALSEAVTLNDKASEEPDAPRWVRFAGPVELDYATGMHYLRTGHAQAAVPFLRAAVDNLAADYARNTALYRARLAGVLLAVGDVDEACHMMARVVQDAEHLTSGRLAARITAFERHARGVDSPHARDLLDLIASRREHP